MQLGSLQTGSLKPAQNASHEARSAEQLSSEKRREVAFLEQEKVTQHGISIPPQCCRRWPVISRITDSPRARKYDAILEYSRSRWPTVCSQLSTLIANLLDWLPNSLCAMSFSPTDGSQYLWPNFVKFANLATFTVFVKFAHFVGDFSFAHSMKSWDLAKVCQFCHIPRFRLFRWTLLIRSFYKIVSSGPISSNWPISQLRAFLDILFV